MQGASSVVSRPPFFFITNLYIMDRRTTLAKLFGKADSIKPLPLLLPQQSSLDLTLITGPFEYEHAAHLLRRTMFGPTYQQIKEAASNGLDATLSALLADNPLSDTNKPLNHEFEEDLNVEIGETGWTNLIRQVTSFSRSGIIEGDRSALGLLIYGGKQACPSGKTDLVLA